jgi:hypothetical protein
MHRPQAMELVKTFLTALLDDDLVASLQVLPIHWEVAFSSPSMGRWAAKPPEGQGQRG